MEPRDVSPLKATKWSFATISIGVSVLILLGSVHDSTETGPRLHRTPQDSQVCRELPWPRRRSPGGRWIGGLDPRGAHQRRSAGILCRRNPGGDVQRRRVCDGAVCCLAKRHSGSHRGAGGRQHGRSASGIRISKFVAKHHRSQWRTPDFRRSDYRIPGGLRRGAISVRRYARHHNNGQDNRGGGLPVGAYGGRGT